MVDAASASGLLLAELYAFLVLLIGYFQTAWPLQRAGPAHAAGRGQLAQRGCVHPHLQRAAGGGRQTVFSAMSLDWPKTGCTYVLDDGRRNEFREFCEEPGVGYPHRDNNPTPKRATSTRRWPVTAPDYVAIFDCDHIPTRSFLQICMGWFFRTPTGDAADAAPLFLARPVRAQPGHLPPSCPTRASCSMASCRTATTCGTPRSSAAPAPSSAAPELLEVGGVAVETVTEDAHTALKLSRLATTPPT